MYKAHRVTTHNLHQKAMFDTPTDAEGNPTGNPPIHNWPENTIQEYER